MRAECYQIERIVRKSQCVSENLQLGRNYLSSDQVFGMHAMQISKFKKATALGHSTAVSSKLAS